MPSRKDFNAKPKITARFRDGLAFMACFGDSVSNGFSNGLVWGFSDGVPISQPPYEKLTCCILPPLTPGGPLPASTASNGLWTPLNIVDEEEEEE
ncbi:hypothetical protein V500_04636 [Pseudogymnoascus sp. VKM F-4518 (FW-2643)]|nr:hypothetical protein V500_04636 [Pseudogymnoascus sp. VKM F-4518 (FW-2643)]